MKILKKSSLKFLLIVALTLFVKGCSGPIKKGVNILYLFDISGSYHQFSLDESLIVGEEVFNLINNVPQFAPYIHQFNTIGQISINPGSNCSLKKENQDSAKSNAIINPAKKVSLLDRVSRVSCFLDKNTIKNSNGTA